MDNKTELKIRDVYNRMACNYKNSALLDIVMEYFTLCEMITESLNPELENATEELSVINCAVNSLASGESIEEYIQDFERVRKLITDKMNCVTAYVDRFLVFEHVLNVIAPKYGMTESEVNDILKDFDINSYTMEMLRYIFASQDNMVIHERIHEIIECIPMRMSRKKYLGLVEKGLALYIDSDKASFDEYVYMLRTSSMLYECDTMALYDEEFRTLYDELSSVDYASLDEDYYSILREKLAAATVQLGNLSDVYMCLQKIINMLYVYGINESAANDNAAEFDLVCTGILESLHNVIENDMLDVSEAMSELVNLEGYMETLYEERSALIPLVDEMDISYTSQIEELGLSDAYKRLEVSARLTGGLFAEARASEYEVVEKEYAAKVSNDLLADMESFIKSHNRLVVRAVMALTMGKLPVTFNSSDDVKDYIVNSLEHCSNKYEMAAVKSCIDDMLIV